MSSCKRAWVVATALLAAGCAGDPPRMAASGLGPNLGRAPSAEQLRAWDISIDPSGAGLPAGSGTAREGEAVYAAKCQICHGPKGAGKPADRLAGGAGTLATANAVRTVGSYWPHATTLFDYVRRAMPTFAPLSLSDMEVYAVTAYVLHLNGIVGEDAVMDANSLPQVRMPNRDGFVDYSGR